MAMEVPEIPELPDSFASSAQFPPLFGTLLARSQRAVESIMTNALSLALLRTWGHLTTDAR